MSLLEQAKEVIGDRRYFGTKTLAEALGITGKKASILFTQLDWERWAVGSCTVTYRKKLSITQEMTPRAKEILKGRKYMKSHRLAKMLGLEGISGIVIAGKILASLPEWEVDRCQSLKRTWMNTSLEVVA